MMLSFSDLPAANEQQRKLINRTGKLEKKQVSYILSMTFCHSFCSPMSFAFGIKPQNRMLHNTIPVMSYVTVVCSKRVVKEFLKQRESSSVPLCGLGRLGAIHTKLGKWPKPNGPC